jgi:pimeloyl-ACP methyl ester carboxylesterase
MRLEIRNEPVFVSTGGRPFDPSGKVLLFVHGAGQSHLTYVLQTRFLASRGWQVLAPDMPGHGRSDGPLLTTVGDMADWHVEVLDAAGVDRVDVIGHSMGGLVGIELANRFPDRVRSLTLIASALKMPVNDFLLDNARNSQEVAIDAMTEWSYGEDGRLHLNTMPGLSHFNYGVQHMASNATRALYADLNACNVYDDGAASASQVACPCLCILGEKDRMMPVRVSRQMVAALPDAREVVVPKAGHMLTTENPDEVTAALREFLTARGG